MKYRTAGERKWHTGTTVSLSASGAVIVGDLLPPRTDNIVVVISLPSAGGCLSGSGRITRSAHRNFAIAVPYYRLEHRSAALRRLDVLLQEC